MATTCRGKMSRACRCRATMHAHKIPEKGTTARLQRTRAANTCHNLGSRNLAPAKTSGGSPIFARRSAPRLAVLGISTLGSLRHQLAKEPRGGGQRRGEIVRKAWEFWLLCPKQNRKRLSVCKGTLELARKQHAAYHRHVLQTRVVQIVRNSSRPEQERLLDSNIEDFPGALQINTASCSYQHRASPLLTLNLSPAAPLGTGETVVCRLQRRRIPLKMRETLSHCLASHSPNLSNVARKQCNMTN